MHLFALTAMLALGQISDLSNGRVFRTHGHAKLTGNYEQLENADLELGIEFDRELAGLQVAGDVTLSGTLTVGFDDFEPLGNCRIELIKDARSLRGRFEKVTLPKLRPGLRARLVYDDLAKDRDLDSDGKYDLTLVIEDAPN